MTIVYPNGGYPIQSVHKINWKDFEPTLLFVMLATCNWDTETISRALGFGIWIDRRWRGSQTEGLVDFNI